MKKTMNTRAGIATALALSMGMVMSAQAAGGSSVDLRVGQADVDLADDATYVSVSVNRHFSSQVAAYAELGTTASPGESASQGTTVELDYTLFGGGFEFSQELGNSGFGLMGRAGIAYLEAEAEASNQLASATATDETTNFTYGAGAFYDLGAGNRIIADYNIHDSDISTVGLGYRIAF